MRLRGRGCSRGAADRFVENFHEEMPQSDFKMKANCRFFAPQTLILSDHSGPYSKFQFQNIMFPSSLSFPPGEKDVLPRLTILGSRKTKESSFRPGSGFIPPHLKSQPLPTEPTTMAVKEQGTAGRFWGSLVHWWSWG